MRKFVAVTLVLLLGAVGLRAADPNDKHEGPQKAVAVIHGLGTSHVHGVITFTQMDGYVEVKGEVLGLSPGKHGFHVHEFGDCSAADGSSAGGHFNPGHKMHGAPDDENRHEGDLGNITADDSGRATIDVRDKVLSLSGPNSIVGRSLIVHEKADDLKTQPTGNAGGRIGCAVIGVANPKPPMPK